MIEPRMTDDQITLADALVEKKRLTLFIEERQLNLPMAVFESDHGVSTARGRLNELKTTISVLDETEKQHEIANLVLIELVGTISASAEEFTRTAQNLFKLLNNTKDT